MVTLAVVLGLAGAVLLLVGLVGGGFTFSGTVMPVVGKAVRFPCFLVGGVLVFASIVLAFAELAAAPAEPSGSAHGESVVSTSVQAPVQPALGEVIAAVNIYELPYLGAAVVGHLESGAVVEILCTAQGDAVSRRSDGVTSSLWNGVSGGYVPDVLIDTGTDQATMGNC
jgi:hypothetical protein